MKRRLAPLPLALSLLLSPAPAARAQQQRQQSPEQDEVLKVNTRVVFLDALVTDKKTKAYASGLAPENFEVLADGQSRKVTYFSREGDAARRPLALALVFDLERIGAGRHLRRTEILEAMANELGKLPPGDEVAVVVLDPGGQEGKREWLTGFTRNRGQLASAMSIIPTLVGEGGFGGEGGTNVTVTVGGGKKEAKVSTTDSTNATPAAPAQPQETGVSQETLTAKNMDEMNVMLKDFDKKHGGGGADETDTVVNRKGEHLTRRLKTDGTLLVTKTKSDGTVETEIHDDFDLPRASYEIANRIAAERPNSQAAIVYVTDGLALMDFDERDYVEDRLMRRNVIFSALVAEMKTGFKLARPILSPLGNWIGIAAYGVPQHIAKATGGEVARVRSPNDYARALGEIIGSLNARYSLGFTLADAEADDGKLHPLEVKVRAKDAKGKDRKLDIQARRGYFMTTSPKQQEAKKGEAVGAGAVQTKND